VAGELKETGPRLLTTHTHMHTYWLCADTHTRACTVVRSQVEHWPTERPQLVVAE